MPVGIYLRSKEFREKASESRKGKFKGDKHPNWKGGRKKQNGYIFIHSPNHPHANSKGYVYEHRLVIEKHMGRTLLPTEIVHHINNIRDDNRIENLILFAGIGEHLRFHLKGKPRKQNKK